MRVTHVDSRYRHRTHLSHAVPLTHSLGSGAGSMSIFKPIYAVQMSTSQNAELLCRLRSCLAVSPKWGFINAALAEKLRDCARLFIKSVGGRFACLLPVRPPTVRPLHYSRRAAQRTRGLFRSFARRDATFPIKADCIACVSLAKEKAGKLDGPGNERSLDGH